MITTTQLSRSPDCQEHKGYSFKEQGDRLPLKVLSEIIGHCYPRAVGLLVSTPTVGLVSDTGRLRVHSITGPKVEDHNMI